MSREATTRALAPLLFAALLFAGLPSLAAAAELTPEEARGKVIYLEGSSPPDGEIVALMGAERIEVPASVIPCGGCHGHDGRGRPEGGISPSDLNWPALTKPYGVGHPSGRQHPPYTERLLVRAITMGIDPAGNPLHVAMPRYQLSRQDADDLVAYLRRLGSDPEPGVSDDAITVATLVPREGPFAPLGEAIESVLAAYFEDLNRAGGIYNRRLELRIVAAPRDAGERAAALRQHLAAGDTFALVGAFLPGAEEEVAELLDELETPLIGPFTQHPQIAFPLNRQIFYLLPGVDDVGRALANFATSEAVAGGKPRTAVIVDATPRRLTAAEAIKDRAAELGWPEPLLISARELDVATQARPEIDNVFLLTSGERQAAFLGQAAALDWYPLVLVPGSLVGRATFDAPAGFADRIFLAFPTLPSNQAAASSEEYRSLADRHALPSNHLSAQIATLASAHLFVEALKQAGRELSRDRLIEVLEGFSEVDTGLTPVVTYSPNRRVGIEGAYMVAVDLERKTLVPRSGWIASR